MIVGYARVSTDGQSLDNQLAALKAAGAVKVFSEKMSGARSDRPQLAQMLKALQADDVVIVAKLDRLARSTRDLLNTLQAITQRGAGFKVLDNPTLDTTSPHGRLLINILATIGEFERDLIRERTCAGLAAARARGRKGGRPKGLSRQGEATAGAAETLYRAQQLSVQQIADQLGISKRTLDTSLHYRGVSVGAYRTGPQAAHRTDRLDPTLSS